MSVTVVADLEIKDQELKWVKKFLVQVIAVAPGSVKGFEAGELLENQDDPNNIIIWQQFATRDHYTSYMKSGADYYPAADLQRYMAAFIRPPNIHFFNKVNG